MKKRLSLALVLCLALITIISITLPACTPAAAPTTTAPAATTPAATTPAATTPKPTTPAATTPTTKPAPVPSATVYKWEFETEYSSGTEIWNQYKKFADMVNQATQGRIVITVRGSGEVVPAYQILEAIKTGLLTAGHNSGGQMQAILGDTGSFLGGSGIPGGPLGLDEVAWYYEGGGEAVMNDLIKDYGINVAWHALMPEMFGHFKKPITSKEDFKGMKFRTYGLWGNVLAKWGASVITVAGSEIYQAAKSGIIDAFEYSTPVSNWVQGFHEIMPYVGLPGIHSPGAAAGIVVSHKDWNALSPELKNAVVISGKAFAIQYLLEMTKLDAEAMAKYRAYGTKFFYLSDDFQKEVAAAGKELMMEISAKDATFKRVYEHMEAFCKTFRPAFEGAETRYCIFDE
ncbi:MAG: TRAP transporter substrate-binding protein DctP [Dehalococcoidales bacterium]|nr:TRAP transporter substrate-binding protein DctP [Dehalococcoidales bacterium]